MNKTKKEERLLPELPPELPPELSRALDELADTGELGTLSQVEGLSAAIKKRALESSLGGEMSHHLAWEAEAGAAYAGFPRRARSTKTPLRPKVAAASTIDNRQPAARGVLRIRNPTAKAYPGIWRQFLEVPNTLSAKVKFGLQSLQPRKRSISQWSQEKRKSIQFFPD